VLKRNPQHVRARLARAWIDDIVDARMPTGARWLLGGGSKKRALLAVRERPRPFGCSSERLPDEKSNDRRSKRRTAARRKRRPGS
jgi:hypothetical protein